MTSLLERIRRLPLPVPMAIRIAVASLLCGGGTVILQSLFSR